MTYLILHKVRGEPAFDIAEKLCEGPEPCQPECGCYPGCKEEENWIIPTSGHRAHPYWHQPLDDVILNINGDDIRNVPPMPEDWPDHYSCNDTGTAPEPGFNIMSIVSKLVRKVHRRL